MSSLLIVESVNDKFFIENLINKLNIKEEIKVTTPICNINDYECLEGLSKLPNKLVEVENRIIKDNINNVGIILDADQEGIEKRITFINTHLKKICTDVELKTINKFEYSKKLGVNFACYITNVDGFGELETLLKKIKKKPSPFADCLESWRKCLEENDKKIKEKDFDKIWVNFYQRLDCCDSKEKKQAGRKCSNEASMKKDIWDNDSKYLDDLKDFISLFLKTNN